MKLLAAIILILFITTTEVQAACDDYAYPFNRVCTWISDLADDVEAIWGKVSNETVKTWNAVKTTGEKTLGVIAEETQSTVDDIETTLNRISSTTEAWSEDAVLRLQIAGEQIQFRLDSEREGLFEFIGDSADGCEPETCGQFRTELLDLIQNTEDLTTTLVTFHGTGRQFVGSVDVNIAGFPPADFQLMKDLIAIAPGASLFPLYRAFQLVDGATPDETSLLEALNTTLVTTNDGVMILQDVIKAPSLSFSNSFTQSTAASTTRLKIKNTQRLMEDGDEEEDDALTLCEWLVMDSTYRTDDGLVIYNRHIIDGILPYTQWSGSVIKLIGHAVHGLGNTETYVSMSAGFGLEGEAHFKDNWAKKFGTWLLALGDLTLDSSNIVSGNILSCDGQAILEIQRDTDYMVCILESQQGGSKAVSECKDLHGRH